MMKKLVAILIILLSCQAGYGQLKMNQLFKEFDKEKQATSVNIGNFTMRLASLFTETMGVNEIEVLELSDCSQQVKERLSKAIKELDDPDYETIVTSNESNNRVKVLVNIKEDMIRELVIFSTGNNYALVRVKGKIKPSDLERVVKEHKNNGC